MFTENKITEFTKTVADLPDRPQMTAQALKEYFDSSAEELRVKFNALIDALDAYAKDSFAAVDYTAADGKLTFTFGDGKTQTIDLPLELLIESGHYAADAQSIVLTLANGDALTIPVADLIDTYTADEETLTEKDNTFSVKDGVFAKEAPADGALYARKDGGWKAILEGLPHIRLSEADSIAEGLYVVDDAFADWSAGTSENPLTCALLIAGAELYGKDYENSVMHQMLVLPSGELWSRAGTGEWESIIPSLDGYAKTVDVHTAVADATPNGFELIASGETTEEVNSIIITQDNDGNPFELCDMINIYIDCPKSTNTANTALTFSFNNDIVHQTHTAAINTAAKRFIAFRGVYTGAKWDAQSSAIDGGAAQIFSDTANSVQGKGEPIVTNIKIYIYSTARKLPVGFKYEIYGRRVKNANT